MHAPMFELPTCLSTFTDVSYAFYFNFYYTLWNQPGYLRVVAAIRCEECDRNRQYRSSAVG